ncbi:MAG: hypothetical protein NTZ80_04330 [Patescibacteria group bacterium]|nr:hypothetical protein [Patescibacteria group bacterium]
MANKISEQYFIHKSLSPKNEKALLERVLEESSFLLEKELFRRKIYDTSKIYRLTYQGFYKKKKAVLTINLIEQPLDEAETLSKFKIKNKSSKISLPTLLVQKTWDDKNKYSWLIAEFAEGKPLISESGNKMNFPSEAKMKEFANFFEEFRTNCLQKAFLKQDPVDRSVLIFCMRRAVHWSKIAEAKSEPLNSAVTRALELYFEIAPLYLSPMKMTWQHGHLYMGGLYKTVQDKYLVLSNTLWGFRPEYYDTTFHIWWEIKSIRNTKIQSKNAIEYIEKWRSLYMSLSSIKKDPNFSNKFDMMMLERCLGAILIDIDNQHYKSGAKMYKKHLLNLFYELFNYFAFRLIGIKSK